MKATNNEIEEKDNLIKEKENEINIYNKGKRK